MKTYLVYYTRDWYGSAFELRGVYTDQELACKDGATLFRRMHGEVEIEDFSGVGDLELSVGSSERVRVIDITNMVNKIDKIYG